MRKIHVIYDIGTKVWLNTFTSRKEDWIAAIVFAISLRKEGIRYHCSWFHNGERREACFVEEELEAIKKDEDHFLSIGFCTRRK